MVCANSKGSDESVLSNFHCLHIRKPPFRLTPLLTESPFVDDRLTGSRVEHRTRELKSQSQDLVLRLSSHVHGSERPQSFTSQSEVSLTELRSN